MSNSLPYAHISESTERTANYIKGRKTGDIKSLSTGISKLDAALLNGIEWGRILTIGGISGTGKSTVLEQIKRGLLKENSYQKFKILSFEFEMLVQDQLARNVSGALGISTKDLYSGTHPLQDKLLDSATKELERLSSMPVYHVDIIGTVDEIESTMLKFVNEELKSDEGLIVSIDHLLLTKGKLGEDEKRTIDNLMQRLVALKKYFSHKGIKVLFIVLAQLNRNIETPERVMNADLHYPTKNDIFGASSVYYSSDYVLITHKPAIVNGIYDHYGPPRGQKYPKGLPVFNPFNPDQAMIYWHLIKERFGLTKVLMMVDEFDKSRVGEYHQT